MFEHEHQHEVRIHIDQHRHESPNPTTGEALYRLGDVAPGLVLYREVSGDREDGVIPAGPETVHLKEDEHFHSGAPVKREYHIKVNTRPRTVETDELSFNDLVKLAFNPVPTGPNILFTITYRHGPKENPQGNLLEGGSVKLKDGMVFNVTATDKS
jgi:hypothetical protein